MFVTEKLVCWCYQVMKKFENMFDTIHKCDRQMDGHCTMAKIALDDSIILSSCRAI